MMVWFCIFVGALVLVALIAIGVGVYEFLHELQKDVKSVSWHLKHFRDVNPDTKK